MQCGRAAPPMAGREAKRARVDPITSPDQGCPPAEPLEFAAVFLSNGDEVKCSRGSDPESGCEPWPLAFSTRKRPACGRRPGSGSSQTSPPPAVTPGRRRPSGHAAASASRVHSSGPCGDAMQRQARSGVGTSRSACGESKERTGLIEAPLPGALDLGGHPEKERAREGAAPGSARGMGPSMAHALRRCR